MSSDGSRFPQTISACLCLTQSRFQKANLDLRVSVCLLNPSIHTESSYNSIIILIMNSYDTVWYSMIPNPPKVSCVCARQMAPTCSDTHDFSRSPGTKTIAWVAWTNQTVGQVLICRRFVDFITFRDERLVHCFDVPFLCRYSVGIRLSWFPSMMKNVSKAARSPPLSVLPDQINQIADWHVTSGSFLIFSDLCAIVLVSDVSVLSISAGPGKVLVKSVWSVRAPCRAQNSFALEAPLL